VSANRLQDSTQVILVGWAETPFCERRQRPSDDIRIDAGRDFFLDCLNPLVSKQWVGEESDIKVGAQVVRHAMYVPFQMAEVAVRG
jgi:hypothetical protein